MTSQQQLAWAQAWEKTHPEQARARKARWWSSDKGLAWRKAHQKTRNEARKAWRAKRRAAGLTVT